jgi:hypothetical protein
MMTKQMEIAFGLIVLFAVMIGFGFVIYNTQPTQSEIESKRTVAKMPLPENVLNLDIAKDIMQLDRNGEVPVKVAPSEIGRENPFLPF